MSMRLTPDTRPNVQIDFDDAGNIVKTTEDGKEVSNLRGQAVLAENQNKNISLDILRQAGIEGAWEMKNGVVNIVVAPERKTEVEILLTSKGVTVNG